MKDDSITLVSTTDSLKDVQAALGVTSEAPTPAAEAPATTKTETPAAPAATAATPTETPAAPVETPAAPVETPTKPAGTGKSKDGLQARIDELVRQRDTARGMSAAQEAELEALRARVKELAGGQPPKAAEPAAPAAPLAPAKPKVEDYPDYDTYVEALIEWRADAIAEKKINDRFQSQQTAEQQEEQNRRAKEIFEAHEARITEAKSRYDDFDEVVSQPDVHISTVMRDGILLSERGPDIAYYLATHPEERTRLLALGDTPKALIEFGKLETKVEAELSKAGSAASGTPSAAATPASTPAATPAAPVAATPVAPAAPTTPAAPAAPAVTKAPDPIDPVTTGSVATTVRPDQMSYADYKKWRESQLATATGGR